MTTDQIRVFWPTYGHFLGQIKTIISSSGCDKHEYTKLASGYNHDQIKKKYQKSFFWLIWDLVQIC